MLFPIGVHLFPRNVGRHLHLFTTNQIGYLHLLPRIEPEDLRSCIVIGLQRMTVLNEWASSWGHGCCARISPSFTIAPKTASMVVGQTSSRMSRILAFEIGVYIDFLTSVDSFSIFLRGFICRKQTLCAYKTASLYAGGSIADPLWMMERAPSRFPLP